MERVFAAPFRRFALLSLQNLVMPEPDLNASRSELWEDHELEPCPRCGANRLTPGASGMNGFRVCLDCGVLTDGAAAEVDRAPS
jgi:hypothetical protein